MGQLGFFDADKRLQALSARGDPLEAIDRLVPWESFRAEIEAVVLTPDELKKSSAGRKPFDAILMFRMLVLQALNNLSDEQVEYQVRDRLSFSRFLGLAMEDSIPDATTLWLFREKLAKAGLIEKLFDRFDQHLAAKGYMARGGQIIDASIVPVPTQRNSRDENAELQAGRTPAKDRLAEPGLQHSPPSDAGTARRGMKTVESSAVFQPKQWAEKEAGKTIENRTKPELVPNQASKSNIVRGAHQRHEALHPLRPHLLPPLGGKSVPPVPSHGGLLARTQGRCAETLSC